MKFSGKFTMAHFEEWAKTVRVNKELDEIYKDVILFPEKLERAKEVLKKIKLPK